MEIIKVYIKSLPIEFTPDNNIYVTTFSDNLVLYKQDNMWTAQVDYANVTNDIITECSFKATKSSPQEAIDALYSEINKTLSWIINEL